MAGKFVLTKTSNGQFLFSLKAGSGEKILTSETYKAKASAESGIQSVKTNATLDAHFDRRMAKNGQPYFLLKAANGEVICASEEYSSVTAMENGIHSVKTNAPSAVVDDVT